MKLRISIFPILLTLVLALPQCPPPPTLRRVSVTPTHLTYAPRVVGSSPSAAQVVTLKNISGSGISVTMGQIRASGDYSQNNDCPDALPSGASCHINVSFAPEFVGKTPGGLTINDNAGGPQLVSLSGSGIAPVEFSPSALNFGAIALGTTSSPRSITLTNKQSTTLHVTGLSASGDYHQLNNCPSSLSPGGSCTINIVFHPTVSGFVPGALRLATDAVPGTQPVALSGSGSGTQASRVSFTPASLSFGGRQAGTTSPSRTITLKNTSSDSSLTVFQVLSSGPNYQVTNTCIGKLLGPSGTCTIQVAFHPTSGFAPVTYPGAITVVDSGTNSPQVIGLTGIGVAPVTASPSIADFGARGPVIRDPNQNTKRITFTNKQSISNTLVLIESAGYSITNNGCSEQLAPGGKCSVDVLFRPKLTGTNNGAVTISPDSGGPLRPQIAGLTGCGTTVDLSTYGLKFGSVAVGSTTAAADVDITNLGASTITLNSISITGSNPSDFAITHKTCGSSLEVGASCTVSVAFKPKASGARSANLSFSDSGNCSPQKAALIGSGT